MSALSLIISIPASGIPPRSWGKHSVGCAHCQDGGKTPALTGQTGDKRGTICVIGENPRRYGASEDVQRKLDSDFGIPPHVRGELSRLRSLHFRPGYPRMYGAIA